MRVVTISLVAFSALIVSLRAAEKRDLPSLVEKTAAAVKAAIPGSELETQGRMGVVKKSVVAAPQTLAQDSGTRWAPGKRPEIPSANGVIFIIDAERYWTSQPFAGRGVSVQKPKVSKTPAFDHQHAKPVGGYYHTNGMQVFEKSNVVLLVEILFGQRTDTVMLQRAYAELARVAASEL